jgi:EAL domain-containing protein (putative c-di-GMP-specific phosphodiesterase class I)
MSSSPQIKDLAAVAAAMPFDSYGQVLRMLMPALHRVGFYDPRGRTIWVSEGVEEPEFRMHLDLVLARFTVHEPEDGPDAYCATDQSQPIFIFPIRDSRETLLGAVGLLCRELPVTAAHRRFDHVERLLKPILQVIQHGWCSHIENAAATIRDSKVANLADAPAKKEAPIALPAVLRRTLALASRSLNSAFGAVVAAEKPFTLSHRVSPEESDLAINAAVDTVRNTVLKYMRTRNEPLISNATGTRARQLPYKVMSLPLRAGPARIAAALILFRDKNSPDFSSADIATLAQITAQIPTPLLAELLAPSAPSKEPAAVPVTANLGAQSAAPAYAEPTQPSVVVSAVAPTPVPPAAAKVVKLVPREPLAMEERIRLALREDGFRLYAQRITPMRDSERADRYEILLRMDDGESLQPPQAFFAVAEASELMPELDQWVVRELMATLRTRAASLRTNCREFSVNVSAQTLLTDRFSEYVLQELKRSSIPPGALVFEIAESDAIEHQYSLSILAKRLHNVGCRIALDNCRAGLRTFETVRKWPISCIKIDGSLIRNVVSNCRYESQVRAVAKMASGLGLETVAECVESEHIHERLLSMEIDYLQGFHFGRPLPLAEVLREKKL